MKRKGKKDRTRKKNAPHFYTSKEQVGKNKKSLQRGGNIIGKERVIIRTGEAGAKEVRPEKEQKKGRMHESPLKVWQRIDSRKGGGSSEGETEKRERRETLSWEEATRLLVGTLQEGESSKRGETAAKKIKKEPRSKMP